MLLTGYSPWWKTKARTKTVSSRTELPLEDAVWVLLSNHTDEELQGLFPGGLPACLQNIDRSRSPVEERGNHLQVEMPSALQGTPLHDEVAARSLALSLWGLLAELQRVALAEANWLDWALVVHCRWMLLISWLKRATLSKPDPPQQGTNRDLGPWGRAAVDAWISLAEIQDAVLAAKVNSRPEDLEQLKTAVRLADARILGGIQGFHPIPAPDASS